MKPLRIGLLIDSFDVPSWVASIAADVEASDAAHIAVVVLNRNARSSNRILPRYRPRLNPFRFAEFYLYLDHWKFRPLRDAVERVDLSEDFQGCQVIDSEPIFDDAYFRFRAADESLLRACDLDVLLMFWSGLPAVQVFSLARYGVWLFLDQEHLFGGRVPIGFWEVLHQRPILMQCLQAYIASSPKPMTLHRYYGPTNPRSIRLSRNNLLWKSASCVSRKLDELHRVHSLGALMHVQDNGSSSEGGEAPSNLTLVRPIAKRVSTFLRNRVAERRYVNQWIIGYRFAAPSEALDVLDHNFAQYRLLIPPTDRYWADPFPVQHEGRYFLFFEEVLYSEAKGHLCVAEINDDGLAEQPRVLLKREYHMSYPFIFSWRQEWYLIPETQAANRIDVYKFDSFPYKASYCGTIMDNVNAVDATLLEADGRWWMFVAMAPEGTWNVDELFLFHAESPFGPWLPHRKNPIKSDVRSARPAGGILARKGKYYRPAQDCSYRYGYAVRFQEIELLSEADYLEREVGAVLPGWSPEILATHTVNAAGGLNVIDVQQQRRR